MFPDIGQKGKTVLVLCIDRDNDLERKAGIKGPVIGRTENLKAAEKLALSDPADSDVNAIFKTTQVFDEIKKKSSAEIITLTGDANVGIASDRIILLQLDKILKKRKVAEAIVITDGAEDEYVLPLIRSRIKDVYTQKIIVKQNNQLEGAYYLMYEFLTSVLSDKKAANMFIGLPAIAILIYTIFGNAGGRLILGVIGAYLFVKGFQLEPYVSRFVHEIHLSLKVRKASFFLYIISFAFLIIGVFSGYETIKTTNTTEILLSSAYFIESSIFLFFVSAVLAGIGKMLSEKKIAFAQHITYFVLMFAGAGIMHEISAFVLAPQIGYSSLISTVLIGGAMVAISSFVEKRQALKKK